VPIPVTQVTLVTQETPTIDKFEIASSGKETGLAVGKVAIESEIDMIGRG
jgi:hypothetical protein